MTDKFFRFPHTPHVAWSGAEPPREDKVLSDSEIADLFALPVVIEEKLDGANLGFSVGQDGSIRAQNRGQYLIPPFSGQFAGLGTWLREHEEVLFDYLHTGLIAFGEWCAATHTLEYENLPDWWLMFDVFERGERFFWATSRRNDLARQMEVKTIPIIFHGRSTRSQAIRLAEQTASAYRDGDVEGVVIRQEDNHRLLKRAKYVNHRFVQSIDDHWRSRPIQWNGRADRH